MQSTLFDLQPWLSGATAIADAPFDGVSTDSRKVAPGNLFVALRGERFDAHAFLPQVAQQGAAAVVVERRPEDLSIPALVVPDTRIALAEIARHWRRQFSLPVIGVTGSNGKTTVKEMIAAILAAALGEGKFLATAGNLNNDIGVPLTVLRLDQKCRAAVIELGMNHPGEIAVLSAIAQPTVALVNNAQREHQEFMASVEAVAKENGDVLRSLPANGTAVFPADDPFTPLWRAYATEAGQRTIATFGFADDADVTCDYALQEFGSDLLVKTAEQQFSVRLAAAGMHNVRNALAAIACTLAIGVAPEAVQRGLESFAPVSGRLQRKTAKIGALVIDDTYNANPDSVRAAIEVLANAAAPRILVLGDMGEVGNEGKKFHEEIGAYARGRNIEFLLTLGELSRHCSSAFGARARHYDDIAQLQQALQGMLTPASTVLVKGSRFMKMERVVQHLLGTEEQGSH
jgi:UDP-N-acetylmuramoyl-tripeptide--D-alanyl-D-alanine ligase